MLEHAKSKTHKEKKLIFNFVEGTFLFKPEDALVTTRGAGRQAKMVFGQAKGKNKPPKKRSCYLYGQKDHIAKF